MKPKQKVIIYNQGLQGFNHSEYMREYNNKIRESKGFPECLRCRNRYKNPNNNHYVDYKNKIPCIEKIGLTVE